jgi:hypothetical protein
VKNKVAEGLLFRGWVLPADLREATKKALHDTAAFGVGPDGKVVRATGGDFRF